MAGIYIHIPFCGQLCTYCDFHFSTSLKDKETMVDAIITELEIRRDYLGNEKVKTLYFGGGTPSILSTKQISKITDKVKQLWRVNDFEEFTIEANPEDLTQEYLESLKTIGVTRLSIGIQSFDDEILKFMNRRHTAKKGFDTVVLAKELGFKNITIDLIYGIENMSEESWTNSIKRALSLNIQHISAYHLTINKGSVLGHKLIKNEVKEVEDNISQRDFDILKKEVKEAGFIHYEVSNFAKENYFAIHNSSYWSGEIYLGVGPSAHSYNKTSRSWNISNNRRYIESLSQGVVPSQSEILCEEQIYNEHIMTSLRTIWGVDIDKIESLFCQEICNHFKKESKKLIKKGDLEIENKRVFINESRFLVSDYIISQLFI